MDDTRQPAGRRRRPPAASKFEIFEKKRPLLDPIVQRPAGQAEKRGVKFDETVSFGAFAQAWLGERQEEHRAGELALNTWQSYRRTVRGILVPTLGEIELRSIDLDHIRRLRQATQEIPAAGNQALDLVRRILTEAERQRLRPPNSNPARRVRRHPEMASARPADPSAVRMVFEVCDEIRFGDLDVCHPTMAALFQMVALTGARPTEIRTLRWEDVYYEEGRFGVIRLRRHKTVRKIGEKRIVLGPTAREVIDSMRIEDADDAVWVFPSHVNPGHPYNDISRAWRRVVAYADLGDLCLRDLRTGLATNAYDDGVPLEQIQEMLGHKSISTTRRYTRISASRVSEAFETVERTVFGPGDRGRRRKGGRRHE